MAHNHSSIRVWKGHSGNLIAVYLFGVIGQPEMTEEQIHKCSPAIEETG
jgi:hypothetical protein